MSTDQVYLTMSAIYRDESPYTGMSTRNRSCRPMTIAYGLIAQAAAVWAERMDQLMAQYPGPEG